MKLLADENFDGRLLRALLRRVPGADVVRAIDVGLWSVDDPGVLDWAAGEDRIVVTHDITTMIGYALARVAAGLPMPGLIAVAVATPIRVAVEDLELLLSSSVTDECRNRIVFIPM